MLTNLLLALAVSASPTPSRCAGIAQAARKMVAARRSGVTEAEARKVIDTDLDGDARTLALVLVWYIYVANADARTPPAKQVELIRRACLSSETNALSGGG